MRDPWRVLRLVVGVLLLGGIAAAQPQLPGTTPKLPPSPAWDPPPATFVPRKWTPSSATFDRKPIGVKLVMTILGSKSPPLAWANCSVYRNSNGALKLHGPGTPVDCLWIAVVTGTTYIATPRVYKQYYLRAEPCAKGAECLGGYTVDTRIDSEVITTQHRIKSVYYTARANQFVKAGATRLDISYDSSSKAVTSQLSVLDERDAPLTDPKLTATRRVTHGTWRETFAEHCNAIQTGVHQSRAAVGFIGHLQILYARVGISGIAALFASEPVIVGGAGSGSIDGHPTGPGWLDMSISNSRVYGICTNGTPYCPRAVTLTGHISTRMNHDRSAYTTCEATKTTACSDSAGGTRPCQCTTTLSPVTCQRTDPPPSKLDGGGTDHSGGL